ncbi:GNAT family N-acetyltransferase [Amaricoccus sp.]|uniref:GNAT family N-acetyltransferase n=1 Tax=Amaricoccus sp. TaxID=1872485 RepID=UPI001B7A5898|nr:GNAT family N-acetyltransferase [Amaricoccus sp.]MBP7240444.1 GNAT family N-acetyltransferase [Amaricoccus sp.]
MTEIRAALVGEAPLIRALMKGERLNPVGVDWRNFLVAEDAGAVIGIVQLRPAGVGAVEIGSLVVRADRRRGGLGRLLVDAAVAAAGSRRALIVTAFARARFYEAWGFSPIPARAAPWPVRLNLLLGQAGGLVALARGMRPRRLVVLDRPPGV